MKRRILQILSLSLIAAGAYYITGCANVPATSVGFNPATGKLNIKSPKNVAIQEATVTYGTNGQYTLTLKGYSSTNDNSVVTAVAQANAATASALSQVSQQMLTTAIQAAK